MDRFWHLYGLEILRQDQTGLRNALELAQSEQAKAVREAAEAIRVAAAERIPQIQCEMAEATRAAAERVPQIHREIAEATRAAAERIPQIHREMAEATRAAAERVLQIHREMAETKGLAGEPTLQIQREIAEAKRQTLEQSCRQSILGIVGIAFREVLAQEVVARAIRIALERLQRCRAHVVQIRRLLLLTKNRILALLRQLCRSNFPANLILIQKSWFLTHGEHPPKLLAAAIPVCFLGIGF